MISASELAGFFAAHGIWCVSDGETLTPMLAHRREGNKVMTRLAFDQLSDAVEAGRRQLDANAANADEAVLVYDGFINIQGEKLEAIIIETRAYFSPDSKITLAVPYTPKGATAFRVHKPKLLQWDRCQDFSVDDVVRVFFEGVAQHEKGAAIWNSALDESK